MLQIAAPGRARVIPGGFSLAGMLGRIARGANTSTLSALSAAPVSQEVPGNGRVAQAAERVFEKHETVVRLHSPYRQFFILAYVLP